MEISAVDAQVFEALTLYDEEKGSEALEIVSQVLSQVPENVPALHAKVCILNQLKKYDDAIAVCNKIQNLINPATYSNEEFSIPKGLVHLHQATAYLLSDRTKECLDSMETAVKVNKIAPYVLLRALARIANDVEKGSFNFAALENDIKFIQENDYSSKIMGMTMEDREQVLDQVNTIFDVLKSA